MNPRIHARKKLHTAFSEGQIDLECLAIVELILWRIRPGRFWPEQPVLIPQIMELISIDTEQRRKVKRALLWMEKNSIVTVERHGYKKHFAFPDVHLRVVHETARMAAQEKRVPKSRPTYVPPSMVQQAGGLSHPSTKEWKEPTSTQSQPATPQQISQMVQGWKAELAKKQQEIKNELHKNNS